MLKNLILLGVALLPLACGGSSGPANADAFCSQVETEGCDKVFACVPAAMRDATFVQMFGNSPAECKATISTDCTGTTCSGGGYNASLASTCLSKLSAESCTDLANGVVPTECDTACP
jgi:hypothetical protein